MQECDQNPIKGQIEDTLHNKNKEKLFLTISYPFLKSFQIYEIYEVCASKEKGNLQKTQLGKCQL